MSLDDVVAVIGVENGYVGSGMLSPFLSLRMGHGSFLFLTQSMSIYTVQ